MKKSRLWLPYRIISIVILLGLMGGLFHVWIPYVDSATEVRKNGFDITKASIPHDEILQGGPIPAIHNPKWVSSDLALKSFPKNDRAMIIEFSGQRRAYPISILNWHEVINDEIEGSSVTVTYCPLCGTGIVFDGRVDDRRLTFGVSGLLYQSDVLLYDLKDSLWSQIKREAVRGPLLGRRLKVIPSELTPLHPYLEKYPDTQVLSKSVGISEVFRNYDRDPYDGYDQTEALYFPVRLPNKTGELRLSLLAFYPDSKIYQNEVKATVEEGAQ